MADNDEKQPENHRGGVCVPLLLRQFESDALLDVISLCASCTETDDVYANTSLSN